MMTPRILMIYTGGTIGMISDPSSGALKPLNFKDIEREIPALRTLNVDISYLAPDRPIDSSDVTPADWSRLAATIQTNYDRFDGFVVLHGTDTMAWTASALSFMFENLSKPVVFTGSQIPIGVLRTDGRENLVTSVEIAAARRPDGSAQVPEVSIYFQNRLFRANRTTKWSAEQLNAFTSENFPPLAEVGVAIHYADIAPFIAPSREALRISSSLCPDVSVVRLFPGLSRKNLQTSLSVPDLRGVVLQTFGAGNTPTSPWFFDTLSDAISRGIVILNVTQCIAGSVSPLYESAIRLAQIGVISGRDITLEAALTKLMYVLGTCSTPAERTQKLNSSLRGEFSAL